MKLRTILVGLGRIGWKLELDRKRYHPCTHAGTLLYLEKYFDVVGVCDRNRHKIDAFLNWYKKSVITATDYTGLPTGDIDFAIITTGPDDHIEIAEFFIEQGIKTILIEKPLAESTEKIEKLRKLKELHGVKIYVNFERRYHDYYKKVKEITDRKTFGELLTVEGRCFARSHSRDPLLEDGIHLLDLIIWYAGIPDILFSYWEVDSQNIEIRSHHILKKNNVLLDIESGSKKKYFEFALRLDYEKGRIEIGNSGFKIYRRGFSKKYERIFELEEIPVRIPKKNPWVSMYEYIFEKREDNFPDAYSGIRLYEELAKHKPHFSVS